MVFVPLLPVLGINEEDAAALPLSKSRYANAAFAVLTSFSNVA